MSTVTTASGQTASLIQTLPALSVQDQCTNGHQHRCTIHRSSLVDKLLWIKKNAWIWQFLDRKRHRSCTIIWTYYYMTLCTHKIWHPLETKVNDPIIIGVNFGYGGEINKVWERKRDWSFVLAKEGWSFWARRPHSPASYSSYWLRSSTAHCLSPATPLTWDRLIHQTLPPHRAFHSPYSLQLHYDDSS